MKRVIISNIDSLRPADPVVDGYEVYSNNLFQIYQEIVDVCEPLCQEMGFKIVSIKHTLNHKGNFRAERGDYDPAIITLLSRTGQSNSYHKLVSTVPLEILEDANSDTARQFMNTIMDDIEDFAYSIGDPIK